MGQLSAPGLRFVFLLLVHLALLDAVHLGVDDAHSLDVPRRLLRDSAFVEEEAVFVEGEELQEVEVVLLDKIGNAGVKLILPKVRGRDQFPGQDRPRLGKDVVLELDPLVDARWEDGPAWSGALYVAT